MNDYDIEIGIRCVPANNVAEAVSKYSEVLKPLEEFDNVEIKVILKGEWLNENNNR